MDAEVWESITNSIRARSNGGSWVYVKRGTFRSSDISARPYVTHRYLTAAIGSTLVAIKFWRVVLKETVFEGGILTAWMVSVVSFPLIFHLSRNSSSVEK